VQQLSSPPGMGAEQSGPGKDRTVGWLAWLLFVMCLALAGLTIVFAGKRGGPPGELVADMLPAVAWTIAFSWLVRWSPLADLATGSVGSSARWGCRRGW
jgi:hypothetical protein